MYKKVNSIFCFVALAAVLVLTACGGESAKIEKRWGISLPDGITEEYHAENWGWFGDGDALTVYKTSEKFDASGFSSSTGGFKENFETWFTAFEDSVTELAEGLNVPAEYLPDFSQEYLVSSVLPEENSESVSLEGVSLVYFSDADRLFVVERRI